eukprot:scaffold32210_cov114-Skeletonema_menzelii.AAC.2
MHPWLGAARFSRNEKVIFIPAHNIKLLFKKEQLFSIMRPSLALLILIIGCFHIPAAFGRLIPLYYGMRAAPTDSPSTSPSASAHPSAQPSSQPTSSPSSSPSTSPSFRPSLRPSFQLTFTPSSQPTPTTTASASQSISSITSSRTRSSSFITSEAMINPSFGLWEIISLALVGKKRKNTNLSPPAAAGGEEERNDHGPANTVVEVAPESEGDGWLSLLSSFWPGVHSLDQAVTPPHSVEKISSIRKSSGGQ